MNVVDIEKTKEDVTEKEFKNKTINIRKIENNKTHHAAGYAIVEALHWSDAADIIYKNNRKLASQICISALFSIEMFFKSILLNMKINVTTENYKHDIYLMYQKIEDELKEKIKKDVKIDKEINLFLLDEVVRLNTFEEELEYISNDFMYLRYEYEKFLNGIPIITLTDFIMQLKENVKNVATIYNYEKNFKNKM